MLHTCATQTTPACLTFGPFHKDLATTQDAKDYLVLAELSAQQSWMGRLNPDQSTLIRLLALRQGRKTEIMLRAAWDLLQLPGQDQPTCELLELARGVCLRWAEHLDLSMDPVSA